MKKASRTTKSTAAKLDESLSAESVANEEVSIDRRRANRRDDQAESLATPPEAGQTLERRKKVNRRRQIDPTTCERDYTDQEVEFMNALDDYKRKSGRMFPTCSEVLEVLRGLGYIQMSAAEISALPADSASLASAKPMPSDWPATAELQDEQECSEAKCEPDLVF
jgi:hypothetical protein